MEIRKIGQFSTEELETLAKAGQILGDIKRAFEVGDITELDETAKGLLMALKEVIEKAHA